MKGLKRFSLRRILRLISNEETKPSFVFPAFILPEERVIFKTNPHWLAIVIPEVALVATGFLIVKYLYPLSGQFHLKEWFLPFFGGALTFVMIVIFLYWLSIKYYLPNLRLELLLELHGLPA